MNINKQAFSISGTTLEDYLTWCKATNRLPNYKKNRNEFFKRIIERKITRNIVDNSLIIKNLRKEETKNEQL